MLFIVKIDSGTVTSATSDSSGEIVIIMISTPTSVSVDVSSWLSVCWRLWATLSMSLVTRLSMSPRGCRSTYRSGMPVELVLDIRAQAGTSPAARHPASMNACRYDRTADVTYTPSAMRRIRCSLAKSIPWPVDTPCTMTLVALPRILGAITSSVTLVTARMSTADDAEALGAQPRREPAGRVLEVLRPLERHAGRAPAAAEPAPGVLGRRLDDFLGRRRAPRRSCRSSRCGSCRLLLAELGGDDLGVGRAGLEQFRGASRARPAGRPRSRGSGRR